MIVLLNKPYGVLCQFTDDRGRPTLADYIAQPGVYPAGRLDFDSEGLVVLTDDPGVVARLSQPRHKTPKLYAVEVEGAPVEAQLQRLRRGIVLRDGPTLPAEVRELAAPPAWLWPRDPPVRLRKTVPTRWLEMAIVEGRNRQVRRMTAAVGLPTLRLIRVRVGPHELAGLGPGESRRAS